jgi:hypothetical protein
MALVSAIAQFASAFCSGCVNGGGGCAPIQPACTNGQCTAIPTGLPL